MIWKNKNKWSEDLLDDLGALPIKKEYAELLGSHRASGATHRNFLGDKVKNTDDLLRILDIFIIKWYDPVPINYEGMPSSTGQCFFLEVIAKYTWGPLNDFIESDFASEEVLEIIFDLIIDEMLAFKEQSWVKHNSVEWDNWPYKKWRACGKNFHRRGMEEPHRIKIVLDILKRCNKGKLFKRVDDWLSTDISKDMLLYHDGILIDNTKAIESDRGINPKTGSMECPKSWVGWESHLIKSVHERERFSKCITRYDMAEIIEKK